MPCRSLTIVTAIDASMQAAAISSWLLLLFLTLHLSSAFRWSSLPRLPRGSPGYRDNRATRLRNAFSAHTEEHGLDSIPLAIARDLVELRAGIHPIEPLPVPRCVKMKKRRYTRKSAAEASEANAFSANTKGPLRKMTAAERKARLRSKILQMESLHNGTLLNREVLQEADFGCRTTLLLHCVRNHTWEAKVEDLAYKQYWCRRCFFFDHRLSPERMQRVANCFDGKFLGFVEDLPLSILEESSTRNMKARWRCANGHEFVQRLGNICRKPGGKRPCSWCPKCRKMGFRFAWLG